MKRGSVVPDLRRKRAAFVKLPGAEKGKGRSARLPGGSAAGGGDGDGPGSHAKVLRRTPVGYRLRAHLENGWLRKRRQCSSQLGPRVIERGKLSADDERSTQRAEQRSGVVRSSVGGKVMKKRSRLRRDRLSHRKDTWCSRSDVALVTRILREMFFL